MMRITMLVNALLLLAIGVCGASTPIVSMSRAGGFSSSPKEPESMPEIHMTFQGHSSEPESAWIVDDQGEARPVHKPATHQSIGMPEVARELKADGARLIHQSLKSLADALAETDAIASGARRKSELLDAGSQYKQQGSSLIKQGLKSMMKAVNIVGDLGASAHSQTKLAEAEMEAAVDQHDALQLLKSVLMRMLDALKAMGPSEDASNWLAAIDHVEQGVESLKVLGSKGRDGGMLIKRALVLIFDACASSNAMTAELTAETLATVTEGAGMLEQAAAKLILRGVRSMVNSLGDTQQGPQLLHRGLQSLTDTHDASQKLADQIAIGTEMLEVGAEDKKAGQQLVKRGLKSMLDTFDESNELMSQLAMTTEMLNLPTDTKIEGRTLVKRGLNSILDALDESKKLVSKAALATERLDLHTEGKKEGVKLVKKGVKSVLDAFDEANKFADAVEMATEMFNAGMEDNKEGAKVLKRGLKSVLDNLDESSALVDAVSVATSKLDKGMEDKKRGVKLIKNGLATDVETLRAADIMAKRAAGTIDLLNIGIEDQQEGAKLIRRGLTSALDTLNESDRMTMRLKDELRSSSTDFFPSTLSGMLDSILNSEVILAQRKVW